ncbi:(+)-neomenthol dehydrogenase-like [Rutidosis leptorrhynchoides]|uniref:(+)-neomenthol dehydrogenase-like n=1 Tax=Rutidosis leptorrhynchoides TaxID=125765 RepID=UPI003A99C491
MGQGGLYSIFDGLNMLTDAGLPPATSKQTGVSNAGLQLRDISSNFGELQWIRNEKVKVEFMDIENITEEKIDEIIQRFLTDFKGNKLSENGWPLTFTAYKISKAAVNGYTRLLARKFHNILFNSVHPGYVITDIASHTGFLTAEEGAKAPVMVALLPDDGLSGVYFYQMQVASF